MFALRRSPLLSSVLLLGSLWSLPWAQTTAEPATSLESEDESEEEEESGPLSSKTFQGMALRSIGPAFMSGRIADIAVHPEDPSTWWVAVGSGGVWKTTNAGTTWEAVFDGQDSYSIGCVTVDPSQPSTVWVGTGENVGGRHVGYGDGVYKSTDGGATWKNVGLEDSEHIGKIVVDPTDSNVVYVASQGPLWSGGGERGLFKSSDGGSTWQAVLTGGEYTGVNDVVLDPRNPEVVYASTHQRLRNVAALMNGGPESGIHKSRDGGATWTRLKSGLPGGDMGKIGLAISPQRPDVVYAAIELENRTGGFYRSSDAGASWEKRSDYVSGGTGPHYYQEIFASPHAFDRVYHMDVRLHVTEDGGKNFRPVGEQDKHVDNHAMAFHPHDPDYLLVGCDGGLYQSWDLGSTWRFTENLPVTQFYKVALDNAEPFYNVFGGTQDNNTQGGPSRTDNAHGIRNADWFVVLGGDGHQPATDPENEEIVYAEWQQGNLVRHDRRTGEIVYIQPQPADGEPAERFNWDAPILVSPHAAGTLFFASQRVWRSDDRGDSWRPISGDLSRGIDRMEQPMMGRLWPFEAVWDLYAMSMYGTVTSLSQSPLDENLLYAGTDDGHIQITEDGGETWRLVDTLPDAPELFFVNDIKADLHDPDAVYVVVDDHKSGDFSPYLYRSEDRGRTWTSMMGDLPERHVLWRLVQDHVRPELFFLGTEFGVFFTVDRGERWIKLEGGVPTISFRDLAIQKRENDLVGATFGRGFYVLDDFAPLREVDDELLEQDHHLFAVRDAWWYVERRPLGGGGRASQGGSYFLAENPPFGAVFNYYVKEGLKTRKEERKEAQKEEAKEERYSAYPGWETLRAEDRELEPAMVLTVRDASGRVVRRLRGPVTAGLHRVAWDLCWPSTLPWREGDDAGASGFLVTPGTFSVTLGRFQGGELEEFSPPRSFEVKPMGTGTLAGLSPTEVGAFYERLQETQTRLRTTSEVLSHTLERASAAREALARSTVPDGSLLSAARDLENALDDLRLELSGDSRRGLYGDPGPVSISERLGVVLTGNRGSTYGPTATHLESLRIAERDLEQVRQRLQGIRGSDLPALEARLDAAGVPWTPGRGVVPR